MGGLLRSSIAAHDLPVIVGIVMFTTTTILVINLVIDVLYALIDPRIQASEFAAVAQARANRRGARTAAVRPATSAN